MIVYDNIIYELQRTGGISVVWKELSERLLTHNEYILRVIESSSSSANIFRSQIHIDEDIIYKERPLPLFVRRYLPVWLPALNNPFVFHSSYYRYSVNRAAVNVSTVHDFTYDYFVRGMAGYVHKRQKYAAVRNSKYIVCISENTKRDLQHFLPDIPSDRIRVIYNGVSDDYRPLPLSDFHIPLPFEKYSFILFVGARSRYKNFEFAVTSLAETRFNLVIVGAPLNQDEHALLNRVLGSDRYHCTGRITNEHLNFLYNCAFALLYPSSYEGFGIPVIEAQKAGCPVIAFNASSIPEIIGDKSLLLEDLTCASVYEKLKMLEQHSMRDYIIAAGIENARRFSWDTMYSCYSDLYQEALLSV